ncbi:hypothetical protein EC957_002963, partial [Mortierella hygrophila]
ANARRVISRNITQSAEARSALVQGIRSCFQHVAKQASEAARTLQCGIGMYLESLSAREVDDVDKLILRKLCPDFTVEEITAFNESTNQQQSVGQRQDQEHDQGSQSKYNEQESFLKMLLNAIMNSTQPGATANMRKPTANMELAREFFNRINLYGVSGPPTKPAYPASVIAQLVANQLYVELKNHYKNDSLELCKKIEVLKKKELLPAEATTGTIDLSMSAIQNFLGLNKVCGRPRCLVPMSPMKDRFITLMELELVELFWRNPALKCELQRMAFGDYTTIETPVQVSQADVCGWIGNKGPGALITNLITDVGSYTEHERRGLKGYSRSTFLMSLEGIREHLRPIRQPTLNPARDYTAKGYVPRGSIRTDGFRLQVLAYKLNELSCVRYKRLPLDQLPSRLTSTLSGLDDHLTEIRNVIKTKEDVAQFWGCPPSDIKILGIDLGKAFLVGASAILPPKKSIASAVSTSTSAPRSTSSESTIAAMGASTTPSITATNIQPVPKPALAGTATSPQTFFNLSVKQKAVYQPTLKHRKWLERQRMETTEGAQSISDIESHLPPCRGPDGSVEKYVNARQEMETVLYDFYNKPAIKKNAWNAQLAKEQEFSLWLPIDCCEWLGGLPAPRDRTTTLSLSGSALEISSRTMAYLRSTPPFAHILSDWQDLWDTLSLVFMHRDELAGHNMCNIIQGYLLDQKRPQYLQPVYADGTFVWAQNKDKDNDKDQDPPECSVLKARSEERGRPTTAKDISKDESRDSRQTSRALFKHPTSVAAKDFSMDEPQDTSQPGRTPVKRAPPDPLEEETPLINKTIRLG